RFLVNTLLLLPRLIWFQQIDQWRDARPILERLSEMRRLDRQLICELGDALRNRQHSHDLLACELELPYRRRSQAVAVSIQRGRPSRPAACLCCAGDQLLIWLATPAAPMGHALLGAGVCRFDHDVGVQRRLECWSPSPGDDRLGCAATREVGVTSI